MKLLKMILIMSCITVQIKSDIGPGMSSEILEKAPHCEKSLVDTDTAIVEMDIIYQHGDISVSGQKEEDKGRLHSINLGGTEILKSLRDGMVGMCIGEKKRMVIPPNMAYGDRELVLPDGRKAPAKSTVIATVKVVQILRQTEREKEGIFRMLDTNQDGMVDENELLAVYGTYSKMTGQADQPGFNNMIGAAMKLMDKDKNGYIDKSELFSTIPSGTKGMSAKMTDDVLKFISAKGAFGKPMRANKIEL